MMPNDVVHFAVGADDCQRAKTFYESVFGWRFEPWGPPNFWLIHTSSSGILGALQERHEPQSGTGSVGFECTIGVEDITSIAAAIKEHGGKLLHDPILIETVGTMVRFNDTEGNIVGAMQYLEQAKQSKT